MWGRSDIEGVSVKPVYSRLNFFMIDDICRGGINLLRVFLIGIYWNDYAKCFKYFMRKQLRSLVGLLFSDCGGEINIIVYVTVFSVIYSVFRRS
jgi:hypothetical protein